MTSREQPADRDAPSSEERDGGAAPRPSEPGTPPWMSRFVMAQLFLFIYLLSTGPMYWRIHEAVYFPDSAPFIAKMYYPVVLACQWSDTFSDTLDWYVGLWVYGELDERELPPLRDEPSIRTAAAHPAGR